MSYYGTTNHDHYGQYADSRHDHREIYDERYERERDVGRVESYLNGRIDELWTEIRAHHEETHREVNTDQANLFERLERLEIQVARFIELAKRRFEEEDSRAH